MNDVHVYKLKIYDQELLSFSYSDDSHFNIFGDEFPTHILSVNEDQKHLFPLDLELTDSGLLNWLERRVIPKNRAFVLQILSSLGLEPDDIRGIIDVCKGLSLNDSYWIVPDGFEGRFSDYNLYENRFSEALSLVAYTGYGKSNAAFSTSPELTTHGMLRKAWRFLEQDGIYLYKGGTDGAANAGNEPFAEYYACQVAETMGLNAVHYDLENWKGILASKCRLFTDIDTAYIPIGKLVKSGGITACLEYYQKLGSDFYEQLCSMLVFDAVIYNEDRHFGNFGVLRDNHSGNIIAPAPLFDHGLSLFTFSMENDWRDLSNYAKERSNPYGALYNYTNLCQSLIGPVQSAQLHKLIDFHFKRHPSLNWPEERLKATEQQLHRRVREILNLPRLRDKKHTKKQPRCL